MKLLRVLGVLFGVAVTLGGMLGIGILRTPGMVAASTGSSSLTMLMWAGGAAFSLCAAVSIAELGVLIPKAGGFYVYAVKNFPPPVAFAVGWCDCLGQVAGIAYAAVTAADLLAKLGMHVAGIAPALILAIAGLQWLGIRAAGRAQQVMSFAVAACYCALIAAAFVAPAQAGSSSSSLTKPSLAGLMLAFRAVIVAYDGWYTAIYFSEEVKEVSRNLPRAMIRGTLLVAVVYLGVNAALLHVLGVSDLARSAFPAADAAKKVFGSEGERAVLLIALLSLPSLMNALMLLGTRILYGMGISRVNRGGTPDIALALTTLMALVLALTGTFDQLLAAAAFFFVTTYVGGFLGVFIQRRRNPEPRAFRAWLYPWSTAAVLAISLLFLAGDVVANPRDALRSVAWIAGSYPVYLMVRKIGGVRHEQA